MHKNFSTWYVASLGFPETAEFLTIMFNFPQSFSRFSILLKHFNNKSDNCTTKSLTTAEIARVVPKKSYTAKD